MKLSICVLMLLFSFLIFSQENTTNAKTASVENNIFAIQASVVSLHISDEFKIKNNLTLYSEFGYNLAIHIDKSTDAHRMQTYWAGKFRVEPRFYYNLKKRSGNGKSISNNSGNYVGLSLKYYPKKLSFSNFTNLNFYNTYEIGLRYGLKRNIGNSNFNYEFTVAPVFVHQFRKEYNLNNRSFLGLDLTFRFGYNFTKKK